MRVATVGRYKLQGLPEPKKPVQKRQSISPQRSPSPLPPPPSPPKLPAAKPAGPSALSVENKKYIDNQRQALSLFIGAIGPISQNIIKNNNIIGGKNAKFDFQQYEQMLNQVDQSFSQILEKKASFEEQFITIANKKISENIARQLKSNPESASGIINDQIGFEKELASAGKDIDNQLQKIIVQFAGLRKNIALKKKNAQNLKKVQSHHDDLVGKGEEMMEQLRNIQIESVNRIRALENKLKEANNSKIDSAKNLTGIMRKKTDLPLKAPALAKKKSSTALLGKAPPPLKQPEFTINGMDERILQMMIHDHMAIEKTDSKSVIEQKINERK